MAVAIDGGPVGYLVQDQGEAVVLDQIAGWMRDCGMLNRVAQCESELERMGLPAQPQDGLLGQRQLRALCPILDETIYDMQLQADQSPHARRALLLRAATVLAQAASLAS